MAYLRPPEPAARPRRRIIRFTALLRVLSSRRAAVTVMVVMGAVLALASFVPEADFLDPARRATLEQGRPVAFWVVTHLRPADLSASPAFLVLPIYLFGAIAVSVYERVKVWRRQRRREPRLERFVVERDFVVAAGKGIDRVSAALRAHGYRVELPAPGQLVGRRGDRGFLGSILFHMGLLLILGGVAASGLTRSNGEILLTEGFPRAFEPGSFLTLAGASRFPPQPGRALAVRDFVAEYSKVGTPVDFAVLLSILGGGGAPVEEAQVRVNQALSWNGFQFTLHRYGFALTLVALDSNGRTRVDGVALLRLLPPGQEDGVILDGGGELRVKLWPDFASLRGRPGSRSLSPRRPVVDFRWLDADGREIAAGRVPLGGEVVAAQRRVRFASLGYWCGFLIARDAGLWFFVLGSLAASLGLALRVLFPDQAVRASITASGDGTRVHLVASTRFFPALHENAIDALVERLRPSPTDTTA